MTDFTEFVVNWGTGMIDGLDCDIIDRAGRENLVSTFELLGPNYGPVIIVFVDRRASSLDGMGLGGSDGGGGSDDGVVADSMGATAALTMFHDYAEKYGFGFRFTRPFACG